MDDAEIVGVMTSEAFEISKFADAFTDAKFESAAKVAVTVYVPTAVGLVLELAYVVDSRPA